MLRIVLCSLLVTTSALACWGEQDFKKAKGKIAEQAPADPSARITGTIKFTCITCKETNTKKYDLPYSNLGQGHTLLVSCTECSTQIIAPLGKYTVVSPKNAQ